MARVKHSIHDEVRPIIDRFIVQIAKILERRTAQELKRRVLKEVRSRAVAASRTNDSTRGTVRCYFPGCKNIAAPRFGMFCAALHKNLSAATKARYRAERLQKKTTGK